MRKRVFATSVVVTVALADVACKQDQPTGNPPGPTYGDGPEMETAPPEPEPRPEPEPEPEPEPDTADSGVKPPPGPTSKVEIVRNEDGTCTEFVNIDCPPDVACNPPPPREVPCPPEDPKPKPE